MDIGGIMNIFTPKMKNCVATSFSFWSKRGYGKVNMMMLTHNILEMKYEKVVKIFEHFNINIENFKNEVINTYPVKKASFDVNFDNDLNDCISQTLASKTKEFGGFLTNDCIDIIDIFKVMYSMDDSSINSMFTKLGISPTIINEFLDSLDDSDSNENKEDPNEDDDPLMNLAKRIANGGNNISNTGSSNDAIDTLERPDPFNKPSANVPVNKKKNSNKSNKTPAVDQFSTDMIEMVASGKIENIIGRDKEIEILMEILCRKNKRNALLLGDAGVGKTAIVEGLAIELYNNRVPVQLKDKRLVSLDINAIVAGTRFRGDFEERMNVIINELSKNDNIIVFIDEIHTIMGAGNGVGGMDVGNVLKPALARGDIQVVGATTQDEYSKYFMKDGALERRFQTIQVDEPSESDAEEILRGLKSSFEKFHHIKIEESAITTAVRYSKQYMPSRFLPDKSIDLLDIAGAKTKMRTRDVPDELTALKKNISEIIEKKDSAARSGNTALAQKLYGQELSLKNKLEQKENEYYSEIESEIISIDDTDIAAVISRLTDIPTAKISQNDADRLLNLENIIAENLVGQKDAVISVCKAIRRARSDLHDKKKPIGNFLFAGPTGVGKTELARQLAKELFGKETNLLKFDMSEYSEKFDVSKLLGSAPGFVGYEEGGKLTEAVRKTPYSIVLFDEIEKAHSDIFNILLQVLEDGVVTDGKGRKVYFNNCIIILTSNIGAEKAFSAKPFGFGSENEVSNNTIKEIIQKEYEMRFRPEFLNRLDDIIIFQQLTTEEIAQIVDLQIQKINDRIKHRNINITITDNMRNHIIDKGYNKKYGARPINRAIMNIIGDYMAEKMLRNIIKDNMNIEFDYIDNELKCNITEITIENNNDYGIINNGNTTYSADDIEIQQKKSYMSELLGSLMDN